MDMESERKREVLSTGLLVALGVALGVCLGQAGTARAILAHTHGHLHPTAARNLAHDHPAHSPSARTPSPRGVLPQAPFRMPLPGAKSSHSSHAITTKTKKPHKPGHTHKPTRSPRPGKAQTATPAVQPSRDHRQPVRGHAPVVVPNPSPPPAAK